MRQLLRRLLLPLALMLLFSVAPRPSQAQGQGWLVSARRSGGQSDLWAMPAGGGAWQRLTDSPGDERHPAWSPDGRQLVYAARRERNWDLYLLDLRSGQERRLTDDPHFDGFPAWSPDGTQLAFASSRMGDLDLFLLPLDGGEPRNLTPDSPAHDFEPRWETAARLLFVSTRNQAHDLFRLDVAGEGAPSALPTVAGQGKRGAMVRPDGGLLVVRALERTAALLPLDRAGRPDGPPLGWGGTAHAAALAPDGSAVAWLERRWDGDVLYRQGLDEGPPQRLSGPLPTLEGLAWGSPPRGLIEGRLHDAPPPPRPPLPAVQPSSLVLVPTLNTEQPRLSEAVLDPYQTLRARVAGEVGFDFLGTVSETLRPIDFASDDSDFLSWHKAGRAVDTLFDLGWREGRQQMEVVREDQNGEIYWRLWLRCPVQDGSCGEPLVQAPWDFSYEARWERSFGLGGTPKRFQAGYYVDFTTLAADEGWERIAAYETPEFDWRETTVAMEYWHYQRNDGLRWYDAMREVYDDDALRERFDWATLQQRGFSRWLLRAKGMPLPSELRHAPADLVMP